MSEVFVRTDVELQVERALDIYKSKYGCDADLVVLGSNHMDVLTLTEGSIYFGLIPRTSEVCGVEILDLGVEKNIVEVHEKLLITKLLENYQDRVFRGVRLNHGTSNLELEIPQEVLVAFREKHT